MNKSFNEILIAFACENDDDGWKKKLKGTWLDNIHHCFIFIDFHHHVFDINIKVSTKKNVVLRVKN